MVDTVAEYCLRGEPDWKERAVNFLGDYLFVFVWFVVLFRALFRGYHQRQRDRAYARARSELLEMDRAQALALQGRYQATSCPICLENFKSSTVGSDDRPIKLLRCGHVFDETCWSEWINSGRGNITKCPICQEDVGGSSVGTPAPATTDRDDNDNAV